MTSINNQEKKGNGLLSGGKFGGTNTPGNVASPVASNPEHTPTGYLPSQGQSRPGPASISPTIGSVPQNGQATNNQPPPPKKGLLGGAQSYTLRLRPHPLSVHPLHHQHNLIGKVPPHNPLALGLQDNLSTKGSRTNLLALVAL